MNDTKRDTSEPGKLRGVCMYCGAVYRDGPLPASHGICPEEWRTDDCRRIEAAILFGTEERSMLVPSKKPEGSPSTPRVVSALPTDPEVVDAAARVHQALARWRDRDPKSYRAYLEREVKSAGFPDLPVVVIRETGLPAVGSPGGFAQRATGVLLALFEERLLTGNEVVTLSDLASFAERADPVNSTSVEASRDVARKLGAATALQLADACMAIQSRDIRGMESAIRSARAKGVAGEAEANLRSYPWHVGTQPTARDLEAVWNIAVDVEQSCPHNPVSPGKDTCRECRARRLCDRVLYSREVWQGAPRRHGFGWPGDEVQRPSPNEADIVAQAEARVAAANARDMESNARAVKYQSVVYDILTVLDGAGHSVRRGKGLIVGEVVQAVKDLKARADAAEARGAELLRERDEARLEYVHLHDATVGAGKSHLIPIDRPPPPPWTCERCGSVHEPGSACPTGAAGGGA